MQGFIILMTAVVAFAIGVIVATALAEERLRKKQLRIHHLLELNSKLAAEHGIDGEYGEQLRQQSWERHLEVYGLVDKRPKVVPLHSTKTVDVRL